MRIYIFIAALSLYITTAQVFAQEDCPWGWQTSRTDRKWPCFLVTNKVKRSWNKAQTFCTQMGGSLLKIDNAAEMNWVFGILKTYHGFFPSHTEWWIGMRDNPAQKGLMWIDRSLPNIATLPWSPGEPAQYNHTKNCIAYADGTLRHQDCSLAQLFICKRPRSSPLWCDRRHGWENINGKCYKVNPKLLTYDDARGACQEQNGDLMIVEGESDEQALFTFVESRLAYMWIGLRFYNTTNGYVAKWGGPQGKGVTAKASYWAIPNAGSLVHSTKGMTSCVYGETGHNVNNPAIWNLGNCSSTQGMTSCVYGETGHNVNNPAIWNLGNCSQRSFSVCQKAQGSCASGWTRNGAMCYALNTGPKLTWADARSYCRVRGADLIRITSQTTQDFINRNLRTFGARGYDSIWIGLTDGSTTGSSWVWSNGARLSSGDFNNTNAQSAVNRQGVMDCFTIFTDDKNGTWQVAANCSTAKKFLCSIALNKAPTLPTTPPPTGSTLKPTFPVIANWSTDCGPFWFKDATTGYCYKISDHSVTWAEAQAACQGSGANLASVNSYHEERFISDHIFGYQSAALWIGMNNLNTREGYEWIDGSGVGYFNWNQGEPNNKGSSERCAEFIAFQELLGKWNDVNCYSKRGYICKRKATDFSTTPIPTAPQVPANSVYGCPNAAWQFYRGSCFLFMTRKISWNDANAFCQTRGFTLASIVDENEQNFVMSQLPVVTGYRDQFWLGLSDWHMQMNFQWTDKSPVGFANWARKEPNNAQTGLEDCVTIIQQSGQWNDELCEGLQAGFVCKTPRTILPKSTPQYNYAAGCPSGTIGYGYKCYRKVTGVTSFNSANLICSKNNGQNNGHLAVIHDKYQQAFLASQIAVHTGYYGYFWIGLQHDITGKLQWVNGDNTDFTAWSANHTGNDNTSCYAMTTRSPGVGLWVDTPCFSNIHYICEYPREHFSTRYISKTTQPVPVNCPTGWREYGGYCYKGYSQTSDRRTWLDARDFCQGLGADLVSIHTAGEKRFAFSWSVLSGGGFGYGSRYHSYWIGLNNFGREKVYQWSDGTNANYTSWGKGEPNDASGTDHCVEHNTYSSTWNDNNCYIVKPFVCKVRKGDALRVAPLTTPSPPDACAGSPGWKEYNNSCYYISPKYGTNTRLSWFDAQKFCLKNNGHLASIHSEQENNFVLTLITSTAEKDTWVGMSDLGVDQFGWTDGTPFDYTKWSGNEPNNAFGSEHCGQVQSYNGFWNDNNCGELYNFICKKPKQGATTGRVPTTNLIHGGCPTGFSGIANDNKCYKVVGARNLDQRLNYTAARDACRSMGSHADLASISNHQELAGLLTMVNGLMVDSAGIWIGLNDQNKNYRFTWQDSSRVQITNWAKGQPRRQGGRCVEMFTDNRHGGTWNAIECDATRPYVCEAFRDAQIPDTTPASGMCKPGYIESQVMDCYKVQNTSMTWLAAQASCQRDGASLTSIMTVFEQAFIDIITSSVNNSYWIGLGDQQLTGTFLWSDNFPVLYTNWAKGEPTYAHGEHCVATGNGFWNDTMCGQLFPSVCKISPFAPPPPTRLPVGYCKDSSWKAYGDFCYYIVLDQKKWQTYDNAASDCVGLGMQLTSIMSKNEENIILKEIDKDPNPNANVWIGIRRRGGYFQWLDGSQTSYINWPRTGPTGQDCAYMRHADGVWTSSLCTTSMGYVCKTKKLPPTSPPPTTTTLSTTTTTSLSSTTTSSPAAGKSSTPPPAVSPKGSSSNLAVITQSSKATGPNSTPIQSSGTRKPATGATQAFSRIPRPQTGQSTQSTDLSGGAIAGIIIGVVIVLALAAAALMIFKNRSGARLFDFKLLRNQRGFDNAAYDKSMDTVEINGASRAKTNGHANGSSVGFQDFDHNENDA